MSYNYDFYIDTVQYAKKTWINTFVQHEEIKTALNDFVDGQTEYTKTAVKLGSDVTSRMVAESVNQFKNMAKIDWTKSAVEIDRRAIGVRREVEGDAALAGVVVPEVERAVGVLDVLVERADAPLGHAARRLHLHHVRAEVGHELAAPLAELVRELEHAHAGERARDGGLVSRHAICLRG